MEMKKKEVIIKFKGDKLLGYTTEDESRGINIILNEVDEMITEYKCGKGNVVINLTNMKTKVKVKLKNNKPTVKLKINSKGAIQEINCNKNLEKNTTIKEIEKSAEKSLNIKQIYLVLEIYFIKNVHSIIKKLMRIGMKKHSLKSI